MPNTTVRAAAEGMPAISRRSMLTGTAATLLAAPAISAAQANEERHPDTALLMLGEQLRAEWAETDRRMVLAKGAAFASEADTAYEAAYEAAHGTTNAIEAANAFTLEGLRVKAYALLWCAGSIENIDPGYEDQNTTDKRLAKQIILSLLLRTEA